MLSQRQCLQHRNFGASWTAEKAATDWVTGRVVVAAAFLSPLTSCFNSHLQRSSMENAEQEAFQEDHAYFQNQNSI
ncbi:hypothetical protein VNO77_22538 [Canavalia gladiata]|uniref:Uncharacterized protein n=1 Tax=Canavalia gladiata TaxID=3824 RepID=A0AAN9L5D7_CANGL